MLYVDPTAEVLPVDPSRRPQGRRREHETERLARALFSGPVAIAISTIDELRWVRVNDAFLLLTGHQPHELLGATSEHLGLFADRRLTGQLMRKVRRGGQIRDRELVLRRNDGIERVALATVEPVELGGELLALWILHDISDRKQAEAKERQFQRELERRNRLLAAVSRAQSEYIRAGLSRPLFDHLLADLVALTGSELGVLVEVRRDPDGAPYLVTWGLSECARSADERARLDKHRRGGLELDPAGTLFEPALVAGAPLVFDPALAALGLGEVPPGHGALRDALALPIRGPAGEVAGVLVLANRAGGYPAELIAELELPAAASGALLLAQRSADQERAADQALRDSEERFRLLVDGAHDYALLMLDAYGRVTSWNGAAEAITGYQADEAIGLHLSRFYDGPAVERGDPERELAEAAERGRTESEGWRLRRDGGEFWASAVLTALRDGDGRLRGFAWLTRDATGRKQLERMKDEFVSVVSHELRTPLTSIRGALGLLAGGVIGDMSPTAHEVVGLARTNCERLVRLINDILDLQKIEAGKMSLDQTRIDPVRVVSRTVEGLALLAAETGVRLRRAVGFPAPWRGDEDRLVQVLTNLISNAVKFSPPDREVEVRVAPAGPDRARIAVTDHGPGIALEQQGRLFTKFLQLDGSDARRKGGTGLGLAISRSIVELHGGAIGVDSAPGAGATFWFEVPLWQEEDPR